MCDIEEMLRVVGAETISDLFKDIPKPAQVGGFDIVEPKSEKDLFSELKALLDRNVSTSDFRSFIGGGLSDNYIPSAVESLVGRSEFFTAYTPYQPETSQGFLQATFEYQSMIANLIAMDVVNASLYDWPTALGEAALMAKASTRRREIVIPRSTHWEREEVLRTYVGGHGMTVREVPFDGESGMLDVAALHDCVSDETAAVYIENPNFFGIFEESIVEIKETIGKSLLIVGVNPLSLALVKPPGEYGADIVIGEGQNLGLPLALGGPHLGIFAFTKALARKAPGRIVGLTVDEEGRQSYCITLQTREQHIRREKATSNICSNQALCALQSAVYMATMGESGLRRLALDAMNSAHELASRLGRLDGVASPLLSGGHFNEFVVRFPIEVTELNVRLLESGIFGGLPLKPRLPELGDSALYATSGKTDDKALDKLTEALEGVLS